MSVSPIHVIIPPRPKTKVLVSANRIYFYREADYVIPLVKGLEQMRSSLRYQGVESIHSARCWISLGNPSDSQKAWVVISPLVDKLQLDQVALAYKVLAADA